MNKNEIPKYLKGFWGIFSFSNRKVEILEKKKINGHEQDCREIFQNIKNNHIFRSVALNSNKKNFLKVW